MQLTSIIILNYNTFDLTCNCLKSVYEKTRDIAFEIILVDNASTECIPERFVELFPEIKLIKNNENRGFSKGCNDGIAHAKGEYILLLNSDTVLLNDAIGICLEKLKTDNNIGVCTCRIENPDGTPQNNCQRFPSFWLPLGERLRIHKLFSRKKRGKIWLGPYFDYNDSATPHWVWGTFFMFPRKILEVFPQKKLTETFWMYLEDMEWCWKIKKTGMKISFVHKARILHFGGDMFEKINCAELYQKNYKIFMKEHFCYFHRFFIKFLY